MGTGNSYGSLMGLLPSNSNTNALTNGTQTTVANNKYDATAKTALDNALTSGAYSKDAAIADARSASDYAIKQALTMGAPAIASGGKQSGGYNSTTQKLLGDNLTVQAAGAGQQTLLNAITSYANANSNTIGAATGAVGVTKAVDTTAVTNGTTATTGGSKGGVGNLLNPAQGAGTVICTQLYVDGHISRRVYNADCKYVRLHLCYEVENGYRFWAVPFVGLMRRSRIIYAIGKFLGTKWSEHCASKYCAEISPNLWGKYMLLLGAPLCKVLGSILPDVEYMKLWSGK